MAYLALHRVPRIQQAHRAAADAVRLARMRCSHCGRPRRVGETSEPRMSKLIAVPLQEPAHEFSQQTRYAHEGKARAKARAQPERGNYASALTQRASEGYCQLQSGTHHRYARTGSRKEPRFPCGRRCESGQSDSAQEYHRELHTHRGVKSTVHPLNSHGPTHPMHVGDDLDYFVGENVAMPQAPAVNSWEMDLDTWMDTDSSPRIEALAKRCTVRLLGHDMQP